MGWICPVCGAGVAPSQTAHCGGAEEAQTVAAAAQQAAQVVTQSASAAVVASSTKPKAKQQKQSRSYDAEGWDAFWASYPLRLDKGKAYDAYCAALAAGADADAVIAAAQKYASWCRINDVEPRHIKYAQGWLNAERWNDEIPIPAAAGELDPALIKGTPEWDARELAEEERAIREMA